MQKIHLINGELRHGAKWSGALRWREKNAGQEDLSNPLAPSLFVHILGTCLPNSSKGWQHSAEVAFAFFTQQTQARVLAYNSLFFGQLKSGISNIVFHCSIVDHHRTKNTSSSTLRYFSQDDFSKSFNIYFIVDSTASMATIRLISSGKGCQHFFSPFANAPLVVT